MRDSSIPRMRFRSLRGGMTDKTCWDDAIHLKCVEQAPTSCAADETLARYIWELLTGFQDDARLESLSIAAEHGMTDALFYVLQDLPHVLVQISRLYKIIFTDDTIVNVVKASNSRALTLPRSLTEPLTRLLMLANIFSSCPGGMRPNLRVSLS